MPTSVKLDDGLKQRITQLARARDRSPHYLMREAIERYVTQEEARESFRQEAEDSLLHFQETGLHVTGDELFAWLRTWGTDDEREPPVCHT
jgi:predicted transcriptional regulator